MRAALTHKTYPTNSGGTFTMVSGAVTFEGERWHVSTGITRWSDGFYHVGHESDPAKTCVRHFCASRIGGGKLDAMATVPEKRALLALVEQALAAGEVPPAPLYQDLWTRAGLVPTTPQIEIEAHALEGASKSQALPATKENRTMSNTCDIVRKWGLGERCTSPALENDHRCKLHRHLETLCGPLPTEKGDFRPERLKKVKKAATAVVEAIVPVSETPAAVMAQRFTPATVEAFEEPTPAVEEAQAPVALSTEKNTRKRTKKVVSPKAR